jgi:multiple sugar transport system substrate-binding protein
MDSNPAEGDAIGWAYREDLFQNTSEKAGFKAKHGHDLAVPQTYAQLRDIAEWSYRPAANPPLYGIGVNTQKDYDGLTMAVQGTMFSYGGDWHNACNNVSGVVNSPRNVEAIQMYRALYGFGPPDNTNGYSPR